MWITLGVLGGEVEVSSPAVLLWVVQCCFVCTLALLSAGASHLPGCHSGCLSMPWVNWAQLLQLPEFIPGWTSHLEKSAEKNSLPHSWGGFFFLPPPLWLLPAVVKARASGCRAVWHHGTCGTVALLAKALPGLNQGWFLGLAALLFEGRKALEDGRRALSLFPVGSTQVACQAHLPFAGLA